MRARLATAVVGLVVSVGLSIAVWQYFGFPVFLVFLPFVPFLFRNRESRSVRRCPACGFRTRQEAYEYCPRDGERLE
ncbi:hypothetical protein [Halorientalis marina]|uniref:hypothetical protein n=1 Tax=Halorientalis marina TaxID=2931976 RepID=UPI001FF55BA8|nr:hypothetical protein [Halorientalis marina]